MDILFTKFAHMSLHTSIPKPQQPSSQPHQLPQQSQQLLSVSYPIYKGHVIKTAEDFHKLVKQEMKYPE